MKQIFRVELDSLDGVHAERLADLIDRALIYERQDPGYRLVVEGLTYPLRRGARSFERAERAWGGRGA